MTHEDDPPPESPAAVLAERLDERDDPPKLGSEREVLDGWLDLYRETLLLKIAGLDADALARRAAPPSGLSLLGLVRHLTEVERYWLTDVALGEDSDDLYSSREHPDGDVTLATSASAADDVAAYVAEVESARRRQSRVTDLDAPVAGLRRGEQVNLRWILVHLIEEYARHLGHADLLREAVDGRTGY